MLHKSTILKQESCQLSLPHFSFSMCALEVSACLTFTSSLLGMVFVFLSRLFFSYVSSVWLETVASTCESRFLYVSVTEVRSYRISLYSYPQVQETRRAKSISGSNAALPASSEGPLYPAALRSVWPVCPHPKADIQDLLCSCSGTVVLMSITFICMWEGGA